jgi:hypothetical protein
MIYIFSCKSSVNVLKSQGENASIQLTDGQNLKGELLMIDNEVIFNGSDGTLYQINNKKIRNIHIFDYSLQKEKIISLMPLVLINSIIAVAGFKGDDSEHKIAIVILSILPIPTFFFGDPKVDFNPPFKDKDLNKLKLYCRYPKGLTDEQRDEILRYHNQDTFVMIL